MFQRIGDWIEYWVRQFIVFITNYLPVKVIKDERGRPFLYRYHLFSLYEDGPGMCIHWFVKSDPDRGYHDHPWLKSVSFILCGGYEERIYSPHAENGYTVKHRKRWQFNYLDGVNTFHRVMIEPGKDAWTLFIFQKRSKLWGIKTLNNSYQQMSTTISDRDGGWWYNAKKGLNVNNHVEHSGKVIATADCVIFNSNKDQVLLIKRGKDPFKDYWAFPGGRVEQTDSNLLEAAKRELREETNIEDVDLTYYTTVGNNTRDPRGFCVTSIFVGYLKDGSNVRAGDDAVDYQWFDLIDLPQMAFDHQDILINIIAKQPIDAK
jgi:8-oxo-dGTP diphosphatase